MTTIWMDPGEMRSVAQFLGTQSRRIQEAALGIENSVDLPMPPSVAGWIRGEATAVAEESLRAAIAYLQQALDLVGRADQVQGEQSLAAAVTAHSGFTSGFESLGGGAAVTSGGSGFTQNSGTVDFGPSGNYVSPLSTVMHISTTYNPLLNVARNLQSTHPATAASLIGYADALGDMQNTSTSVVALSRPGATYLGGGLYAGRYGSVGTISDIVRDPYVRGGYQVL